MPLLIYKDDISSYVKGMMKQFGEDQIFSLSPISERLQFLCERLEDIHKEQSIERLQAMDGGEYLIVNDDATKDSCIDYYPNYKNYENFSWTLESSIYQRGQRKVQAYEKFFVMTIAEVGRHAYALDINLYVNETSVIDFLATIISEVVKQYPNAELFCVEERLFGALYTKRSKVSQEQTKDGNQAGNSGNSQDEKQAQPEAIHWKAITTQPKTDLEQILSRRELEVFRLWGEGYKIREIASMLVISEANVKTQKRRVSEKLRCEMGDLRERYREKANWKVDVEIPKR